MELLTAVAVSMLPVSRLRACAAFKLLRHLRGNDALEAVVAACRVTDPGASARAWQKAEVALGAAEAIHASPIPWFDARYPPLLGAIADPPPVLWVTGNAVFLTAPAVAVVGSRAATPYALQVGQRLGAELGGRDIAVVSGLARGVELSAEISPTPSTSLFASYTYTNADQRSPNAAGRLAVPGVSDHLFTLVATQRVGRRVDVTFDLSAVSNYSPSFPFPSFDTLYVFDGYVKADLIAAYTLPIDDRLSLRLYGKVENVFDRAYTESGFRAPGAFFIGGAAFRF